MWVLSQDKEHLVEVHDLSVLKWKEEGYRIIEQKEVSSDSDYYIVLGTYETRNIAIGVLHFVYNAIREGRVTLTMPDKQEKELGI